MSAGASGYSTLEEYLESLRSPILSRSTLNFESLDTPPPLVDAPSDYEPSESDLEAQHSRLTSHSNFQTQPRTSARDIHLLLGLGLLYHSEASTQASQSLPKKIPASSCEDKSQPLSNEQPPMIASHNLEDVSDTSKTRDVQPTLTSSRRASGKLINALGYQALSADQPQTYYQYGSDGAYIRFNKHDYPNKRQIRVSITSLTNDDATDTFEVSSLSLEGSPRDKKLDVRPPPKPMLPMLQIESDHSPHDLLPQDLSSTIQSPTFTKFAIIPIDAHPSHTLARIHDQSSPPLIAAISPAFRQTLPSLSTALSSVTDLNGTPYPDPSPSISRPLPTPHSQLGPPTSTYPHSSPTVTMSPPRLPSSHSSWRTLSHNSSNSTISEHPSAHGSNNGSTPASSIPGQSPGNSMMTPQYPGSDHDSGADSDHAASAGEGFDQADLQGGIIGGPSGLGYRCTWPGCTAAPFQTQYLLNSHTNVHSNQRPHFCPVKDCPRGPGGQGFKRKNEMIRHGLVHQSPGYVCPFCPDQQHKYPRPDNLQRHVRVHHIEKDRDDPMLREVLAQRPEGGNRGRRRRLGG